MNSYPLIKTKWSNERVMSVVFLAAVLYMLPGWVNDPGSILNFIAVLALCLVIDVAANFIRYKRPICAVSAAVTAAVLYALSPGLPLWEQLAAAAVALVAGKHIWGGTGKNPVNPAVLGLLFLALFFRADAPVFAASWLLLPAVLVSLPFIIVRPFAAIGMVAGMTLSLLLHQSLSLVNLLSYGVIFWGCLIITDPVTVTAKPLPGAIAGIMAGVLPMYFGGSATAMAISVLSVNIFSFAIDLLFGGSGLHIRLHFKEKERIQYSSDNTKFYDTIDASNLQYTKNEGLSKDDILDRIEQNGVFGMGGAAFPTARKIRAAIESDKEKHLIVNGVECDPGLVHDKWLLNNDAESVAKGIRILEKCMKFSSVTVAVKHAEGLNFPEDIAVYRVPDYYPAGAEKLLIKEVLGRKLPDGSIPASEGILVLNAQTAAAIYEAVCLNKHVGSRLITVADMRHMSGSVARVRFGANVHDIAESIFPDAACVFSGGGMMSARMAADDALIDESINFIAVGIRPDYRESPLCSKCGYCSAVCPAGLNVNEIARLVDTDRIEKTARLHPQSCMECGSCSHVCLAGRNLAARVKTAKSSFKAASCSTAESETAQV